MSNNEDIPEHDYDDEDVEQAPLNELLENNRNNEEREDFPSRVEGVFISQVQYHRRNNPFVFYSLVLFLAFFVGWKLEDWLFPRQADDPISSSDRNKVTDNQPCWTISSCDSGTPTQYNPPPIPEMTQNHDGTPVPAQNSLRPTEDASTTSLQPHTDKYLLYFAESGWANQFECLEHAYYIARALHRTLLVAPVLPHLGKGGRNPSEVEHMDDGSFKTGVNVSKFYLKKLPSKKYMATERVLDMAFTFPDVETIDVKAFFRPTEVEADTTSHPHATANMSEWVIETNYSHFNTLWTLDRPDLEGQETVLRRIEYGTEWTLHVEYRDIAVAIQSDADIITYMDTFKGLFHESVTERPTKFQPRLSQQIREVVQTVRQDWNVSSYASVHIRGADGSFAAEDVLNRTVHSALDQATERLEDWFQSTQESKVGLYVASDIKNVTDHPLVAAKLHQMKARLRESTKDETLDVQVWSIVNLGDLMERFEPRPIRYASQFMDMQMAACAPIGFFGTNRSTFSSLIAKLRHPEACI